MHKAHKEFEDFWEGFSSTKDLSPLLKEVCRHVFLAGWNQGYTEGISSIASEALR